MTNDEVLPWNVSRCNRLLRPLSSKLAKLRKELELPRTVQPELRAASSAFATKNTPQKTTNFTRPALKPRGFEKARDPDWRPGVKGIKKTYGGRKARNLSGPSLDSAHADNVARPGAIAFTPLIARMGGHLMDSPLAQGSPLKKYTMNREPLVPNMDQNEALGLHVRPEVAKLMNGILQAYANILKATKEKKRGQGTNSLMNTCLKKLPAYIELVEYFAELDQLEEEEEMDGRDVASDVYEQLETHFEQRRGQGWRPFKQVVRAHATSLMCRAVADAAYFRLNLPTFLSYCLSVGAFDEAEEMLLAALPALEPLPIPVNVRANLFSHKSMYMSAVRNFVVRSGRYRFLYDLLEHMVAHELLPLEWLATSHMRPVWDQLVRAVTEGHSHTLASCSRFLETCLLAGMGLPDERLLADEVTGSAARRFVPSTREDLRQALDATFSTLLNVLCSIGLSNSGRDDAAGKAIAQRVSETFEVIVVALASRTDIDLELKLLQADSDDLQIFAQRACWLIFGSFLVRLDAPTTDRSMVDLSPSTLIYIMNDITSHYSVNGVNSLAVLSTLPPLVSATARGTGRIWQDDGFGELQRLVQAMITMSGHHLPHKLWTMKRIALESATEFANYTDEAEHLKYAHDIEKQMRISGRLVIMPTPRKTGTPSSAAGGFRWEDGIGEWVACTPFIKQFTRPQQKPVRALQLLPTPAHSDDASTDSAQDSEHEGEHDPIPSSPMLRSSPLKRAAPRAASSFGKRARAASPHVLIPAKRACNALNVPFYPELVDEIAESASENADNDTSEDSSENTYKDKPTDQPPSSGRCLRRSTMTHTLRHKVPTQRSRASPASGLRDVRRVAYEFGADGADEDSEDELSFGF
ncbi:hypothetical protein C7974DRAFT_393337 [Boeremia exigua]|uniref:uncharacterized protein n=1 Tax=Boeremia exigua TaxID=749465 RepID=UPI001E8DCAFC|nr:uncharacterized protein C7974DRAFT_393337 [Boeremia exigua]KAH6633718.1 hypothetical protein C7974DRAFT_393337 [Boeremia exigua]